MITKKRLLIVVGVVLAVGLLLAPTLTAYAQRQQSDAQAAAAADVAHGPRQRRAHTAAALDYAAACQRRATADDPGDLQGTEACAGGAAPSSAPQQQPVEAPTGGLPGARKHHNKAAPAGQVPVNDATAALQLAVPNPDGQ